MPKLKVAGQRVSALDAKTPPVWGRTNGLQVARRAAVRIAGVRAAGEEVIEEVPDDSVLVLHLQDGFKLFCRYDQFRQDFPGAAVRGGDPDTFVLRPDFAAGAGERALGTAILQGLEILDIKPDQQTAQALAGKVERHLEREPGLYRLSLAPEFALSESTAAPLPGKPALVFLHGTASSSRGSYKGLALEPAGNGAGFAGRTGAVYGEDIFAFEHRTLTEGPIANALALARVLPENARLHLVTHSRGGLIGELLCLGQLAGGATGPDPRLLDRFSGPYEAQRKDLEALLALLRDKKVRVERFVRVACPARGTTLASARADRWFSNLLSLIGRLPFLRDPLVSAVYEALQDFLLAVVHKRTDPAELPGLEAMMPSSPLIRMLNAPVPKSAADLSVIAGDTEGKGVLGALKMWLPDRFYGGRNDLVVNTASMDGGLPRTASRQFVDEGAGVDHFHYFLNARTQRLLLAGLTRADQDNAGYTAFEWKPASVPERAFRGPAAGPRPVVFLLPGIMGSHLAVGGDRIWLDYAGLFFGEMEKLAIDAGGVRPESVMGDFYGRLMKHLGASHEVIAFPYDWRLSLRQEADRLADRVRWELDQAERGGQPVRILAHSMGGLLARVMIARHPDLWQRIAAHPGGRLVMLGTPNQGSHEILRVLTGQSRTLRQLSLLDCVHSQAELIEIVGRFPGLLEMLPRQADRDFFDPARWEELRHAAQQAPRKEDLAGASQTRALLDAAAFESDRMIYVAGQAPATPCELAVEGGRLVFRATVQGDGQVPWSTIPPIPTYYSTAEHGDLANQPAMFPALVELLQQGGTTRLPNVRPTAPRAPAPDFELPADDVDVWPDERTIAASALGAGFLEKRETRAARVPVGVTHGDLAFARFAVAVGHYEGDSIVGPEARLDRHLGGQLRRRHHLGVYPGKLGTAGVFLSPDEKRRPPGAIVVGLGRVGGLAPGDLERSFHNAALKYALSVAECPDDRFRGGGAREANITTLLIGTMANALTVEQSVTAILRAVREANLTLDTGGSAPVLIRKVEFIDLWEDRAIQIAAALRAAAQDPLLRDAIEPAARIEESPGGLRRLAVADDEEWWGRLRVTRDEHSDSLRFAVISNRARAEVELVPQERMIVDDFIRRAIGSSRTDEAVASTLFEMLVPNRLKELWPEMQRMVVVVDEESARYPWELLEDRLGRRPRPIAVDCGIIRQLETEEFREAVAHSAEQTAFVVGNPRTGRFPSLPGAEREAESVVRVLRRLGLAVTPQIRSDSASILAGLHATAYRILHLAGHGVHQYLPPAAAGAPPPKPVSGMIIGDGEFLTPAMVRQMRRVPEFVFVNCCHLARTDAAGAPRPDDRHRLAANLAAEFIRMGVRAVIAAGWAVDDGAASTFAASFYEWFLAGETFGEAVRKARAAAYESHPGINTWGAYQCYGDPGFRFLTDVREAAPGGQSVSLVLPSQLVVEIDNLARRAKVASERQAAAIRARLESLRQAARPEWMERADVLYALGCLYGELGDYGEAAACYRGASASENAVGALRGVEQEAGMRIKAAARGWAENSITPEQACGEIDGALRILEGLLALGETAERLGLKAAAYKRRALMDPNRRTRLRSLREMTRAYKAAFDRVSPGSPYSGALVNWLTAATVLRWANPKAQNVVSLHRGALEGHLQAGIEKARIEPGFWNAVIEPDCLLVRYLSAPARTGDDLRRIAEGYRRARDEGGSEREVQTVKEHLDFLAAMVRALLRNGEALAADLERVRDYLLAPAPVWTPPGAQ